MSSEPGARSFKFHPAEQLFNMVPDDSFFETLGLLDEADPLESCSNSKLEHSTQPLDGDQDTTLSSSFKMWFYVIWDDPGLDRAEFA